MFLAVHLFGPTGRPSRLQSFKTSPPPFGQPARDTTPVQIQQIRDLQNPPSLFVGLDSPEAHVFQYVVCQGPSIERHTQPIEYYPMEVKRNITLIMKRPIFWAACMGVGLVLHFGACIAYGPRIQRYLES